NRALVLGTIRDRGPISRTAIADETRLSLGSVSGITGDLIDHGLVIEQEEGVSTGGRRPVLLALNVKAGLVVGVKLTDEQIVAALTDLGAEIIDQRAVPLGEDRRPEAVVETLATLVDDLRARHDGQRIFGLGLGMAGVIDRRAGVCRFSPFLHWRDVPLGRMLQQRLDLPVVIENDVNSLAMAERWFGAGAETADFLVVTLGRGIGLGMVLDGRLYRGGRGGGGEFGHITVDPNGPVCNCGKRGCLEALAGDPAILRDARNILGKAVTMAEAADLARAGNTAARGIFETAGATIGLALSHLVNIFNPTRLIVGGEGAQALDLLLPPMQTAMEANCFDGLLADVQLIVEPWGDDAWARGAASLMLDELFRPTLYHGEEGKSWVMGDG
ncbi:MAG TPA: ROK family transcriptional regulator, partial [Thermomicrobiales bacterium]|nr:ROK family transcriptional regulator [Thermomicrobiales bacterium]